MKYTIDTKNNKVLLKLSGDIKIHNIAELKKVVLEILENRDEISIDNEQVTEIDLTYYQFLVSAFNLTEEHNKKINVINNPDCFRKLYEEIGITQSSSLENIYRGYNG
jgi:anti-anti-sigma factor